MDTSCVNAPVAQLDRVTDSDSVGHWFESSRAYQKSSPIVTIGELFYRFICCFYNFPFRSCKLFYWSQFSCLCQQFHKKCIYYPNGDLRHFIRHTRIYAFRNIIRHTIAIHAFVTNESTPLDRAHVDFFRDFQEVHGNDAFTVS